MANLLTYPRAPSCLNCLRRTLLVDSAPAFNTPSQMQWRGKKSKLPKKTTIPIRLLKDIPRYGRAGTIVPVPPATMRNLFFPNGHAAYLSQQEVKAQKANITERDRLFGVKLVPGSKAALAAEEAAASAAAAKASGSEAGYHNVAGITAARASELLQKWVPGTLEFHRPVLQTPPATDAGRADPQAADVAVPTTAILGSVSRANVVERINSLLADASRSDADKDAKRLSLTETDVKFVSGDVVPGGAAGLDPAAVPVVDRINALGDFDIMLKVRHGGEVKRRIRVLPEAAPATLMDQPTQQEVVV